MILEKYSRDFPDPDRSPFILFDSVQDYFIEPLLQPTQVFPNHIKLSAFVFFDHIYLRLHNIPFLNSLNIDIFCLIARHRLQRILFYKTRTNKECVCIEIEICTNPSLMNMVTDTMEQRPIADCVTYILKSLILTDESNTFFY